MKESKPYSNILINRLRSLLTSYDSLKHLECDGLTQVLHSVLSDEKIEHTVYIGKVVHILTNYTISIHHWIEVENLRIDYRRRMWLGGVRPRCDTLKRDRKAVLVELIPKLAPTSRS